MLGLNWAMKRMVGQVEVELYAPEPYSRLSLQERSDICDGCGTRGWKGKIVPDNIFGLSIKEACNIHDYMYYVGQTIQDKQEADRTFLNNILRCIDASDSYWFMDIIRRKRAFTYYNAVVMFGGQHSGKERTIRRT